MKTKVYIYNFAVWSSILRSTETPRQVDLYHKILKPWKQFRRNFWEIRFRFRDIFYMGHWNHRFYWFGWFPRQDGEMCVRYRESHAKEPWRQRRSLSSLRVRFINDSELCSVPVDRWNSSNLTWIWLHWTRTVPKTISWIKNRHICCECGAKWCVFELTNATMMVLTQTLTNIPQMIAPRPITKTK